jgi:hypothetical protein
MAFLKRCENVGQFVLLRSRVGTLDGRCSSVEVVVEVGAAGVEPVVVEVVPAAVELVVGAMDMVYASGVQVGRQQGNTVGSEAWTRAHNLTINEQPTEGVRTTREGERGRDVSTQGRLEH